MIPIEIQAAFPIVFRSQVQKRWHRAQTFANVTQ